MDNERKEFLLNEYNWIFENGVLDLYNDIIKSINSLYCLTCYNDTEYVEPMIQKLEQEERDIRLELLEVLESKELFRELMECNKASEEVLEELDEYYLNKENGATDKVMNEFFDLLLKKEVRCRNCNSLMTEYLKCNCNSYDYEIEDFYVVYKNGSIGNLYDYFYDTIFNENILWRDAISIMDFELKDR